MKRKYDKPQFNIQRFTPNEFCSACVKYDLNCNIRLSDPSGMFFPHDLYMETNGVPGLQIGEDKLMGVDITSCGSKFENVDQSDITQGYALIEFIDPNGNLMRSPPVNIWVFKDASTGAYHGYTSWWGLPQPKNAS